MIFQLLSLADFVMARIIFLVNIILAQRVLRQLFS